MITYTSHRLLYGSWFSRSEIFTWQWLILKNWENWEKSIRAKWLISVGNSELMLHIPGFGRSLGSGASSNGTPSDCLKQGQIVHETVQNLTKFISVEL